MRLAPPRLGGGDPLQRQAELVLKHEVMGEPRLIVCGQGNHQRALLAQFHVDARGGLEFGRERRPARLALAPERNQGLFAGLSLSAGGKHAGGRMARARPGGALVEHLDPRPAGRKPPGNAEADHAGADDGDVALAADRYRPVRQPAAPFAGMTQTGSMGVLSAAAFAAPQAVSPDDGDFRAIAQALQWDAPRWRSRRAQMRPTASTTPAPIRMVAAPS